MSTDLNIEVFAEYLFNALWTHHGLISGLPPELLRHPPPEFISAAIFSAVQVREVIFRAPYEAMFDNIYLEFAGNSSYFFDAIVDFFPHHITDEDPDEESVMSAFLSSVAFVADISVRCKARGHSDFLDVGRRAWAMFADLHLKEAFYAAGGWEQLEFFARCEAPMHDYLWTFSEVTGDCEVRHASHLTCGALESFSAFEEWRGVDDESPFALKWVDFCVRVPFEEIRSPDFYSQPIPYVFDQLAATLWNINLLCSKFDDPSDDNDATESSATRESVLELDGESERANCATTSKETSSDGLRTACPSEIFDERDRDETDSDIGSYEQVALVRKLPPWEDQTDSKVIKTEDEESIFYNKNVSSSNPRVETYSDLEEALLGLLLLSTLKTPNDPSYQCSANDSDDTQPKMNTNADDFDTLTDPLRRKKLSGIAYPDSKSRTKVLVKTIDHDNTSISDESREKTPKQDLLSPCKSLHTSPTKTVLNTPDRIPLRRMNSTGSDGTKRKRSKGKENSPSHRTKTDIKKKDNIPYIKRITVTESPNLGFEADCQNCKENQDEYTKKDSFSPNHLSCETSISIDQSLPTRKFMSFSLPRNIFPISDETDDSSKEDQDPSSNKNSLSDSYFESLPKLSAREDLNSLRRSTDDIHKKSSLTQFVQTSSCLTMPHQNSILANDDENYHVLEKPLKIFEPAGKNDLSRPPIEKESERNDRRVSKDSSSTEILTEEKNFSSEPTMENQFKVASGKLSNGTSYFTQFVQTSSCLKVPHQNSILTNDDENYHVLDKPLKVFGPPVKKECERSNRPISQDGYSKEITAEEKLSADPTVENKFKLASGAELKSSFNAELRYRQLLGTTENKMPSAKPTNENPSGFDSKKAKKSKAEFLNSSNDSNREALQTTQSATAEPTLENAVGFSSGPQEKKGKKKRQKKRLSRLEQRIKEEGDGIRDVARLIFVMGHQPGMARVASAFYDSKKQIPKDANNNEK